jgi:hypothetical protein
VTEFCKVDLELLPGITLTLDGNSKITSGNGTYDSPKPNALSLPPVSTCPGSTEACRASCYVQGLAKYAPEVFAAYQSNERTLHRLFLTSKMWNAGTKLALWISDNCPGGFRWHVSGDVMHDRHADWIAFVCRQSPSVQHWIYTRTFELVPRLLQAPNLTVNLSADSDNWEEAKQCWLDNAGTRICYLAKPEAWGKQLAELPTDSVVFPDYPLRGRELENPREHVFWQNLTPRERAMVCPTDFFGQSEKHRCGPCKRCLYPSGPDSRRSDLAKSREVIWTNT